MDSIDLRSDTVTQPTGEMRRAMAAAEVGDDVYGDDPTVRRLEELAAETLGKKAALFVPSGTMGNQLAIMTHTRRGDEVIAGENAHIVVHEAGAPAILSGVNLRTIKTPDGVLTGAMVEKAIRPQDIHCPPTGLVEVENALPGGTVVPLAAMGEVYRVASYQHSIPVHLDGARIFNAAVALKVKAKEIANHADSVMFCVSKGLCAPVGSLLAGREDFIARARKNRKILGGGMRQCGILAAAGIIAVETMTQRLEEDHENARYLAGRLLELPGVELDLSRVQINMVFFSLDSGRLSEVEFVEAMGREGIRIGGTEDGLYRFVTHWGVTRKDVDRTVETMGRILSGTGLK
ncbi:MAG: low-specificity L-threonine aldolase [Oscillospiraceae bacterium]|nr:low-specificity L-threonine aldolase [Oscillospiraceae bacterium]